MKTKFIPVILTAILAFGLTGCTKHKHAGVNDSAADAQSYGMGDNASLNGDESNGTTNIAKAPLDETYHFGFNQADVQENDMPGVLAQGNYLAQHNESKVVLEGNTDERGSREYNVGLSLRRAQAVQHVLEEAGARPGQIEIVSYGKERPIAFGHDEQAWAQNRRVELKYKSTL